MKRIMRFFSVVALCVATVAMNGCSKDEALPEVSGKVVVSTTTIGLGGSEASKHLDESGTKVFAAGEEIAVVYQNTSSELVKTTVTLSDVDIINGGKSATIVVPMTDPNADSEVKFIYPASMANDDGTVNYTALYNGQDGTMATISSNCDLAMCTDHLNGEQLPDNPMLTNQLAVCRFTIHDANSQDMTSSVTKLTVKHGSDIYFVTPVTSGQNTFWVAVKPIAAGSGNIEIYAAVGKDLYKKTVSSYGALAAGTFNRIAVGTTQVPGAISGLFRINADGGLVYFSQGNLQAVCTSADGNQYTQETWTWQFATNQWDYIGDATANNKIDGYGSVSEAGTVDLFAWSTDEGQVVYGIRSSQNDPRGNFLDWGTRNIINGGGANKWHTLSIAQWMYIKDSRASGSTVNGISNARYTQATINTDGTGVNGIIWFPDNVTIATDEATTWGSINSANKWSTKCTTAQWAALEAKGCVFMPAAGERRGNFSLYVEDVGGGNYYWSSTEKEGNTYAYRQYDVNGLYSCSNYRHNGCSVRLVGNE